VRVQFGEPTVIDDKWWEALGGRPREDRDAWSVATSWVEEQLLLLEMKTHPDANLNTSPDANLDANPGAMEKTSIL
jgi:hypothetical protein